MNKIKIREFHEIQLLIGDKNCQILTLEELQIVFIGHGGFQAGDEVEAIIFLSENEYPVLLCIESVLGSEMFAVIDFKSEVGARIYQNFLNHCSSDLSIDKVRLTKISNTNMKEVNGVWLYGDTDHEIYYKIYEDKVGYFQIIFEGDVISFDGNFLSFGVLDEDNFFDKNKKSVKGSNLVNVKSKISRKTIQKVMAFIDTCNDLNRNHCNQILNEIQKNYYKGDKQK